MTKKTDIFTEDSYLLSFKDDILRRQHNYTLKKKNLLQGKRKLASWATGHLYYGVHEKKENLYFREWAPEARELFLIGEFSNWEEKAEYSFTRLEHGNWELEIPKNKINHLDYYKLLVKWNGGEGFRIPSYAGYVTQDEKSHIFCSQLWKPAKKYKFKNKRPHTHESLLIYEAHVGMSTQEYKVGQFREFADQVLPKIAQLGYNAIQLMAIQEHPYYGSFGYQVSNFFAPSSRFGTPDDLKYLIDSAHGLDIKVIMDIVHSHAVKNDGDGLNNFDGSDYQYFHNGQRGDHPAWDTKCFNYKKPEVIHFLLSNCNYWITEFQFDGFRFDGVTSMLYLNHGLGVGFSSYDDYFSPNVDEDALDYLQLANELIGELLECPISIAEDMSGMPGLAYPIEKGGHGFSHRLSMGVPDFWIKLIKEKTDEQWDMDQIWHELTNVRWNEGSISYCESHDQALVGDKTIIFRLADKEMYTNFSKVMRNDIVDRAIALHKMIRALTMITSKDGYLNFMGNEFGHPEWIDFPREGNDWSYHYTRRQWSLSENEDLCYKPLLDFEKEFIALLRKGLVFNTMFGNKIFSNNNDQILVIERAGYLFCFNFNPTKSFTGYSFYLSKGQYKEVFNSDRNCFAGFDRLEEGYVYETNLEDNISLYLPSRSMLVLLKA